MADRERVGREASPTAAVLDSQSIKTTESGGPRGYDAGKKVPSGPAGPAHGMDRMIGPLADHGPQAPSPG
jgi:hypothetical protein